MTGGKLLALALLAFLMLPACSMQRSLSVNPDGTIQCSRTRDISKNLPALLPLLTSGQASISPGVDLASDPDVETTINKSVDSQPSNNALEFARIQAEIADVPVRIARARTEAIKAAVEACSDLLSK